MAGSLDAPIAKLGRAIHHYRTLKDLHGGGDHQNRSVTCEPQIDGLTYKFRIGEVEPLAPEVSLVLGDAYHNLRAALDCLVFQLHERRFRGNLPSRVVRNSGFPIYADQPRYSTKHPDRSLRGRPVPPEAWKTIRDLGARERTAIEWMQPYKGWHPKWPLPNTRVGRRRSGLMDIHKFDIIDKHRQPHLVEAVLISVGQPRFPRDGFGFRDRPEFPPRGTPMVPLKSHAYVDTWTFQCPPPPEYMDMHPGVRTGIGMEPLSGDRIDVLPNLGGSIWVVAEILARFSNRFPPVDLLALGAAMGAVRLEVAHPDPPGE